MALAKKHDIKESEEKWRRFWEKEKIYQFNPKSKKPFYAVDTPPPYVSAEHLHVGHIMSYSQAEFIVRYKRMAGFEVFYPMGFDDNGLPTERFVEKKYKINKNNISRDKFVKKCLAETKIGAGVYKKLWQLLGISVDWTKTYSTIDEHSQRLSQWSFIDLFKKGKIYRAKKPIMWCSHCQTAISQADLEDAEKQTDFVYIKVKTEQGEELVFATTRPELLPSCVGMSVNPKDSRYKKYAGKKVIMPLTGAKIEITFDDRVDPGFGTGLVYFCSSGDRQFLDWEINHPIKNKIYLLNPDGTFNKLAGKYQGLTVTEARKQIIDDLKKAGAVEKIEKISHMVNVHERCGADIEYLETTQWFCSVLDIKEQLLKQADKMNWHPVFMKQKYLDWVNALKWDWCISRQRYFGVPFPVWHCQKCGEVILPQEKNLPVDPTLQKPPIKKCPKCQSSNLEPEKDVMDTWFTSSLTPLIGARLNKDKEIQNKLYPADLRPQAFEIIRTWLFYTVVKSLYHHQTIPFKNIMISGHGLDKQGRKISKRLGNFEPAEKIIEKYGADALRYWATGAGLGGNLRYVEEEVKKGKRTVTKIYNASAFCLSHFKKEDFSKINLSLLQPEDKWILDNLNQTIKKATLDLDTYDFAKARDKIDNFFWAFFCDHYLEFVKHRLYQDQPDPTAKATLYVVLLNILKLFAPFLSYITEEIYQAYFRQFEKAKSIHLTNWPTSIKGIAVSQKEKADFNKALKAIAEIRAFKSQQGISQAKEIPEFETTIKLPENYKDFIQKTARVNKLK